MMRDIAVYLGCLLLVAGAGFSFLAALGVVRLPDLLTRMHAASKAGSVGGGLILLAIPLVTLDASVALRAILGVMFLLLTTPIAAHLLARASLTAPDREIPSMKINELERDKSSD